MKTFAAALVAALASAQYNYTNSTNSTTESGPSMEDMFVLEDGQFVLQTPEGFPKISFTDVDDSKIAEWAKDTEAAYRAMDAKWVDAWESYEAAISAPWNDFVSSAESLAKEGKSLDMQTSEDVINFVAKNTYVDGQSLNDKFPEIQQFLTEAKAEADAQEEAFNLDQLRAPVAMHRLADGSFVAPRTLQYDYSDSTYSNYEEHYYSPEDYQTYVDEPSEFEKAMEEFANNVHDAVISYGYDPKVVNEWFETAGANWEALAREQDIANAKLAQQQVKEASAYITDILEKASADLRAKSNQHHADMAAEFDGKLDEFKKQVDEQTNANYDAFDQWIKDMEAGAQEFANADAEKMVDEQHAAVGFMQTAAAEESSNMGYSFAAIGLVAAGVAAGIYFEKKRNAKQEKPLVDSELEFSLV